ncbi:microfibril-associated glycoprotein 4-like [Puntigrus tetrazona]|uniref:microfibril-associated glycoprotein 4-like n=1 Tax=Puntigrus tetrazona TaxID=1606681 RepID=UPI001C8A7308|nr:microfibril-associated glycoprotein 4-like [Puntigrus tetrazona]
MIVLLCLSALFPVSMGTGEIKSDCFLPRDCSDVYSGGKNGSGVYTITTESGRVQVYCEMIPGKQNDRGHWTVFLRRKDGELNFFRPWDSYKKGFGNKGGEHWLGVEVLHQLTCRYQYKLRVDVEDFQGQKAYALYQSFSVSSEADGYRLRVSGFVNGGAGDSLSYHNGMKFSTFDQDRDLSAENCALKYFQGGFWYNRCYLATPTGPYLWQKNSKERDFGVTWKTWRNNWNSLKSITMKIRRVF